MNTIASAVGQYRLLLLGLCLWVSLSACTPAYTEKTSGELAGKTGLADSISIARGNQRLLSRQGQVCLLSEGADQEQSLLRNVQSAFSGYFVAVGVESQSWDYLKTLEQPPCPGASYLIFLQSSIGTCTSANSCRNSRSEFVFTIVNRGDLSLLDRVQLTVKNGWLQSGADQAAHWQPAFEQLAASLVGATSP